MSLQLTGSGGVLSMPAEHVPGLVALAAVPVVVWLVVCGCRWLASRGETSVTRWVRHIDTLSFPAQAALVASLVGAGVHAALVPSHWVEDRTRALLFVADAVGLLLVFGWTMAARRGWRLLNLGVLIATVVTYAFYLLSDRESLDLLGLLTTTVELSVVLLLLDPGPSEAPLVARRGRWTAVAAVPVALVAILATGAVAGPGNAGSNHGDHLAADHHDAENHAAGDHAAGDHGMAGMAMEGAEALTLETTSPAGPITWPQDTGEMGPGMAMADHACTTPPTASQQRAAVQLVDETVAAVEPYKSLDAARNAGYVPVTPTGLKIVHYVNPTTYLQGSELDPAAIASLVYVNTTHGAVLSAAMYIQPLTAGDQRPPRPGGCLTQWHLHTNLCFSAGVVVGTDDDGSCPAGSSKQVTQPMMHVWVAPVPGGPLTQDPGGHAEVVAAYRLPVLDTPNGTA